MKVVTKESNALNCSTSGKIYKQDNNVSRVQRTFQGSCFEKLPNREAIERNLHKLPQRRDN